jgi:hypothetical protein
VEDQIPSPAVGHELPLQGLTAPEVVHELSAAEKAKEAIIRDDGAHVAEGERAIELASDDLALLADADDLHGLLPSRVFPRPHRSAKVLDPHSMKDGLNDGGRFPVIPQSIFDERWISWARVHRRRISVHTAELIHVLDVGVLDDEVHLGSLSHHDGLGVELGGIGGSSAGPRLRLSSFSCQKNSKAWATATMTNALVKNVTPSAMIQSQVNGPGLCSACGLAALGPG